MKTTMKNKNKKLVSLKSILILVQQLQLKYYGKLNIDIELYDDDFDVTVKIGGKLRAFKFNKHKIREWAYIYQDILKHIKRYG